MAWHYVKHSLVNNDGPNGNNKIISEGIFQSFLLGTVSLIFIL